MASVKAWITAFRLRTLPLSVSGVITGSFLALSHSVFNGQIFVLAIITTLLLQILSNLANDYGDTQNGADNEGRLGPARMVQSGAVAPQQMKRMIILFSVLSFISGVSLILLSNIQVTTVSFWVLLSLGILSISAALKYTMGRNPYGYIGLGDLSVFLFFGLFSVAGTYYLYSGTISVSIFLPAIAIGALSAGVLNINNMRDYENDSKTGKITLVVKLGLNKAKYYHSSLLAIAFIAGFYYLIVTDSRHYLWFYLYLLPLFIHSRSIYNAQNHTDVDKELKKLALITLLFAFYFGILINL